jgi:hypothetical protein
MVRQVTSTNRTVFRDGPRATSEKRVECGIKVKVNPLSAEAIDERVATQDLAVDQHAIAVKDDQITLAGPGSGGLAAEDHMLAPWAIAHFRA